MIKQGWEDQQRRCADALVNCRPAHVVCADGTVRDVLSKAVQVGDVLRIEQGEDFPCDLVLLRVEAQSTTTPTAATAASIRGGADADASVDVDAGGECYITTANVDGEANLKIRSAVAQTQVSLCFYF